jgi:hypothetical protein
VRENLFSLQRRAILVSELDGESTFVDVTNRFTQDVIANLVRLDRRTLIAEEWSPTRVGAANWARLSVDGTTIDGAFAVQDGVLSQLPLAPATTLRPLPRGGFGAVLSNTLESAFVFGGQDIFAQPMEDMWQFDLRSGAWRPMRIDGPAPSRVLAATYRPKDSSLYILDAHTEVFLLDERVRLLRYEVSTGRSFVLEEWPLNLLVDAYSVTNTFDGGILLVGGSTVLGVHYGAAIDPGPGAQYSTRFDFIRFGQLKGRPKLSEDGLMVPLASLGALGTSSEFVTNAELSSGLELPSLPACLEDIASCFGLIPEE